MKVLEQSGGEIMNITSWRYVNDVTQLSLKMLLADVDVTPPRGVVQITWHFNVLHREAQANKHFGFI